MKLKKLLILEMKKLLKKLARISNDQMSKEKERRIEKFEEKEGYETKS